MSTQEFAPILKKVTLKSERIDEWNVRHVFAGSQHLPKCYCTGRKRAYYVHNYETDEIMVYGDLNTIKDFREWCASYDRDFEIAAFEKQEEDEAAEAASQAEREVRLAYTEEYSSDYEGEQEIFTVGERINATFASSNKNCTIGEYAFYCGMVQLNEKVWDYGKRAYVEHNNWNVSQCEVQKVVTLTTENYDKLIINLLCSDTGMASGLGRGGTGTDYDTPAGWDFQTATQEEFEEWRRLAYEVVTVVQAPLRKTFVTNGSGHPYARYVGLSPTKRA